MGKEIQHRIEYYKGIDLLRFIAASCVLLHHASLMLSNKGIHIHAGKYHRYSGSFFLDLFFVISGFLICLIIYKEIDLKKFGFKNFLMRRVLRIWPLFSLLIIVRVIIIPTVKGVGMDEVLHNLKYAVTFTTNFQLMFSEFSPATFKILWSVCIEEHLYIIFPVLAILFKKVRFILVAIMIVVGFIFWNISGDLFKPNGGVNSGYFFSVNYFYYFGFGSLLAVLLNKKPTLFNRIGKLLGHSAVQGVLLLVGFVLVFNMVTDVAYSQVSKLAINGLFATYLVWVAISGKFLLDQFGNKTTRFLGNISYAMYLVHPMMLGPAFNASGIQSASDPIAKLTFGFPMIALIFTILIATVIHFLVERPFLKMKKKRAVIQTK
ncbi:MAG: acyltransferase [Flavobacteriales bacterium]|nr:acyltransferase [Flavobacteriales bacterium]